MGSKRIEDWEGTIKYVNEHNQFHREDGPAYENPNGYRVWYINGMLHREDGPAVNWADGSVSFYLNDKKYSVEDYEHQIAKIKLKRIKDL